MFKKARLFFIIAETPLHAGSGNELGVVDLPIQREKHTGYPKIEASGIKGSIRNVFDLMEPADKLKAAFPSIKEKVQDGAGKEITRYEEAITLAFGPESGSDHAGALGFTDARLLLFPVKSMKGVFAWITCPMVLERFKNDLALAGVKLQINLEKTDCLKEIALPNEGSLPDQSALFIDDKKDKIILEEYTFPVKPYSNCSELAGWLADNIIPNEKEYSYLKKKIEKDIVILPDDDFKDFVNLSTEVVARTRINNETGTVQSGALFYEEYLPQESILYALALAAPVFKLEDSQKGIFKVDGKNEEDMVLEFFEKGLPEVMQIGGNASIGKGIVRTRVVGGAI